MILFDNFQGMHIVDRFPSVVACWVPFPLDKVLQSLVLSEEPVIDNHFYFELLVPLHEVRGGSHKVRTMRGHFSIGG